MANRSHLDPLLLGEDSLVVGIHSAGQESRLAIPPGLMWADVFQMRYVPDRTALQTLHSSETCVCTENKLDIR